MIFQKPLFGSNPYAANVIEFTSFPLHRHYEIEMIYCLSGELTADINGERIDIKKGEMIYIGSYIPHQFEAERTAKVTVIELGHEFLKDDFRLFADIQSEYIKFEASDRSVMNEMKTVSELLTGERSGNNLDMLGCLYKLASELLKCADVSSDRERKTAYDRIAPAIRLIHTNYSMKLTVEDACNATSLSAGNFCTLFKSATGMSFHQYLNRYRVRNAGYLLKQTGMSIDEISSLSGFSDIKTFYRVFRQITDQSPGRFRKNE